MYKFVIVATFVCYASAGVISLDNGWDNNGLNKGWDNSWDNGWNKGWEVAPKVIAAPTIIKTVAAPTIVKTVAVKQGATSWANSNLWSVNPVPVSIPVVRKVAAPIYTKGAPVVIEKSWGADDAWNSKW